MDLELYSCVEYGLYHKTTIPRLSLVTRVNGTKRFISTRRTAIMCNHCSLQIINTVCLIAAAGVVLKFCPKHHIGSFAKDFNGEHRARGYKPLGRSYTRLVTRTIWPGNKPIWLQKRGKPLVDAVAGSRKGVASAQRPHD